MKRTLTGLALATAFTATTAAAQSTSESDHGSAIYQSKRNCPAVATTVCDGRTADQRTVQSAETGGSGQSATSIFTATGTGVGSSSYAAVRFGDFGFPEIKASVTSVGNVRLGNNIYAYQSYTYTGAEEFDLLLAANFHIVDSSTDNSTGNYPGGTSASAGFAIWDADDFYSYSSPDYAGDDGFAAPVGLWGQQYLFGAAACGSFGGDPAPRATSSNGHALSGGSANIAIGQTNCGEETLTLYRGDRFVIASYAQLIANRDAFADATGTFRIGLDPAGGAANIAAFRDGVVLGAPGVPEPATWALMIVGFGLVGSAARRRPRNVAALT